MRVSGFSQPWLVVRNQASVSEAKTIPCGIEGRINEPTKMHPISLHFAGDNREITIMSINTRNFFRTKQGRVAKPLESIRGLAKAIEEINPDIIALQEVGSKRLLTAFNRAYLGGKYANIITFYPENIRGTQVAIMSRSELPAVSTTSHPLRLYGQGLLEATFESPSGSQFTVFTAHLKSMMGNRAESLKKREEEAQMIARILKARLRRNPQAEFILTGDLNTLPGTQVLDIISLKNGNPSHVLQETMLKDGRIVPTQQSSGYPHSKLDYAYVSPALVPKLSKGFVWGRFRQFWRVSDHLPLVTVLQEPDQVSQTAQVTHLRQVAFGQRLHVMG